MQSPYDQGAIYPIKYLVKKGNWIFNIISVSDHF